MNLTCIHQRQKQLSWLNYLRAGKGILGVGITAIFLQAGNFAAAVEAVIPDSPEPSMVVVKANDPDPWQQEIGAINTLRAAYTDMVPVIDGVADDPAWEAASAVTVPLSRSDIGEATLKAVYTDKEIILQISWSDPSMDEQYHPWVWDDVQSRYIEGPQVEDALLVSYEAGCEWNPSLLAGQEYDFDGWLWLAARSNPIGQAVDVYGGTVDHYVPNAGLKQYQSRTDLPEWELKIIDGRRDILTESWQNLERIYQRPESRFPEIYVGYVPDGSPDGNGRVAAFTERMGPPSIPPVAVYTGSGMQETAAAIQSPATVPVTVPQYRPIRFTGDAGDVTAKGQWQDGRWTVEFKRALVLPLPTGTDYNFKRSTQFSIHVFDHTDAGDLDKAGSSWRILLEFEPAATVAESVLTTRNTP